MYLVGVVIYKYICIHIYMYMFTYKCIRQWLRFLHIISCYYVTANNCTILRYCRDCYYMNRLTGTLAETTLLKFGLTFDGLSNPLLVDLGTDKYEVGDTVGVMVEGWFYWCVIDCETAISK